MDQRQAENTLVDYGYGSDDSDDDDDLFYVGNEISQHRNDNRNFDREMDAADRLSVRLLAVENNEEEEDRLLRQSLRLSSAFEKVKDVDEEGDGDGDDNDDVNRLMEMEEIDGTGRSRQKEGLRVRKRIWTMIIGAVIGLIFVITGIILVGKFTGQPPYQPVGPYSLIECQSGEEFFQYYNFYEGADSVGSNGYNQYVNHEHATERGIVNVSNEVDEIFDEQIRPFVYMGTGSTNDGPRDSIRLEGTRRFNRGLFM
jgi:hypothetical protein